MARQSPEARRAALVSLGKEIFSSRPYDAVSTDDIAAAAGISKGLLYHYFPGKREFYVATITQLAADLLAVLPLDPEDGFAVAVPASLDAFLAFIEENATLYRALLRGGIGADPAVEAVVEGVRQTILARFATLLGVTPTPLEALRWYGWLGLVEATSLAWLARPEVDRDALRALWLDSVPLVLVEAR